MGERKWIFYLTFLVCLARALTLGGAEDDSTDLKPRFISQSTNYTARAGEQVILECRIDSIGDDAMIIWKGNRSGEEATIGANGKVGSKFRDRFSFSGEQAAGDLDLVIHSVTVEDEGMYFCDLCCDTQITLMHRLTVTVPPSVTTNPASFITVDLGDPLLLACQAEGKPKPTIAWVKTGDNLPDGRPSSAGEVLEFPETTKDVSGEYICNADNGVGQAARATIEVLVQYAPTVEVDEPVHHTGTGPEAIVSLVCEFSANPPVEVDWRHNGSRISTNERTNIEATHNAEGLYVLQITGVMPEDLGGYECVGGNNLGQDVGSIALKAEPHSLEIQSDAAAPFSDEYTLKWSVMTHEQLVEFDLKVMEENQSYATEWMSNTIPAPLDHPRPKHTQEYTLKELNPSSTYRIKLRARNTIGYSDWTEDFTFYTNQAGVTAPPPTEKPLASSSTLAPTPPSYTVIVDEIEQGTGGATRMTLVSTVLVVAVTCLLL